MLVIRRRTLVIIAGFLACFISLTVLLGAYQNLSQKADIDTSFKVVIDAGHGGKDGGVTGVVSGVTEADLNLIFAKKLANKIEDAGMRAILTRKSSAGLYGTATSSLKKKDFLKRKEIIERESPNLVISIHMNSYTLPSRRGAQVFYNKDNQVSKELATNIQKNLNKLYDIKDYQALSGDYYLLKCTNYPSVIVECGFLTSPTDDKLLNTETFQDQLVFSILCGVVEYFSTDVNGDM